VLPILCLIIFSSSGLAEKESSNTQSSPQSNWAEQCKDWDDWDKPGPPFQIFANSYYVGSCGISAILITGDNGHILIDGGTVAGADIIANNITQLGFALEDVKLLLHSHEHFDHVAGLAKLQKLTGARLRASLEAAPVIRTGLSADGDPQAGLHAPFPAARVDAVVNDSEVVKLGSIELTAIYTPGHTLGALSWQWKSCEQQTCHFIVYADSLSPISNDQYYFSDQPEYVKAYQQGLEKLSNLDCHILIAPHPSASKMRDRLASEQGLIDENGCIDYSRKNAYRLNGRLMKEKRKKRITTIK